MRSILCLAIFLSACSTPQVRCDKHLVAINEPAPKQPVLPVAGPSP